MGGEGTLRQSDLRVESQNLVELFVREEGEGGGRSGGGAVSGAPEEAEIHVVSGCWGEFRNRSRLGLGVRLSSLGGEGAGCGVSGGWGVLEDLCVGNIL